MEIIFTKNKKITNLNNKIYFYFEVQFNENKNGFINFDINNEQKEIEEVLEKIDNGNIIVDSNYPVLYSLSKIFFENFHSLSKIKYENESMISIINRSDI
ncbi:MAG: hypothetical protein RSB77_03980 [Bacilli bacterium]